MALPPRLGSARVNELEVAMEDDARDQEEAVDNLHCSDVLVMGALVAIALGMLMHLLVCIQ